MLAEKQRNKQTTKTNINKNKQTKNNQEHKGNLGKSPLDLVTP